MFEDEINEVNDFQERLWAALDDAGVFYSDKGKIARAEISRAIGDIVDALKELQEPRGE